MYINTQTLLKKKLLTYQEILNIKKRLQGYAKSKEDNQQELDWRDEYKLTPEHTQKGIDWLIDKAFKPSRLDEMRKYLRTHKYERDNGIIPECFLRSNSPFGYRENYCIAQFKKFTFVGFYDATNSYQYDAGYKTLCPIWRCYGKDGTTFDYYLAKSSANYVYLKPQPQQEAHLSNNTGTFWKVLAIDKSRRRNCGRV